VSLSLRFSNQNPICTSSFIHTCSGCLVRTAYLQFLTYWYNHPVLCNRSIWKLEVTRDKSTIVTRCREGVELRLHAFSSLFAWKCLISFTSDNKWQSSKVHYSNTMFLHEYENVQYLQLPLEPHRIVVQGDMECIGYYHFVRGRNWRSVCVWWNVSDVTSQDGGRVTAVGKEQAHG